jgi:hypothetical protein
VADVDLTTLAYPRHLHGPDGAYLVVHSAGHAALELANSWSLTPVLTAEQEAAVRAAQVAAGEIRVFDSAAPGTTEYVSPATEPPGDAEPPAATRATRKKK